MPQEGFQARLRSTPAQFKQSQAKQSRVGPASVGSVET